MCMIFVKYNWLNRTDLYIFIYILVNNIFIDIIIYNYPDVLFRLNLNNPSFLQLHSRVDLLFELHRSLHQLPLQSR